MNKFLVCVLVVLPLLANAQTRTATITFSRPTRYVDGSTIPTGTAITYNLYQGAKGSTKPKVGTITGTSTTVNTGLPVGEVCWQVSAIANGVESGLSGEGCKTFAQPATETVTITVT